MKENQLQRNPHFSQGIRDGTFSEGNHALKKMSLQKLIVWVNILCSTVFLDKICKTLGCIILINSTLEHDMQVPT